MQPIPHAVQQRHEIVFMFDVAYGNPNGMPDGGNAPRSDPETNHGLVTDVALKRRVRDFVHLTCGTKPGHEIYVSRGSALNAQHQRAWDHVFPNPTPSDKREDGRAKDEAKALALTQFMCRTFIDIRMFGAVMNTGVNCGQVRGPVQFTFAQSVEPVFPIDITITRMAATREDDVAERKDQTMGTKFVIPYGLYRAHIFVSAPFASHPGKGTGFSQADLELLLAALRDMFEHDRSASRGEMNTRKLIVFRHATAFGNAHARSLFDRVTIQRQVDGLHIPLRDPRLAEFPPARSFDDYVVSINRNEMPKGIDIIEYV